jgi:hypothetical protein
VSNPICSHCGVRHAGSVQCNEYEVRMHTEYKAKLAEARRIVEAYERDGTLPTGRKSN